MNKIMINSPLTYDMIQKINSEAKKDNIVVVFKNTKGLRKEDLIKFSPNITISIMGGLDTKKKKFNNEYYQKRTYYSSKELISIIDFYEKIERQINPLWNELEKCMFVYKTICEYSNYDESTYNGRDAARNLLGVITGKSVCSGYALIFKEAMDRLNIKCYYQNREGHHSWNIVEVDGNLCAVELTWDIYNKRNNSCDFICFCREDREEFYSNKHHNIKGESEEHEYNVKKCPIPVLQKALNNISSERIMYFPTENRNGVETCLGVSQNIIIKNSTPYLENGLGLNTFIRNDGSSFLILPTNKSNDYIREYVYLIYDPIKKMAKATRIYSEMDLLVDDSELRNNIANNLLTEQRVATKINNFNGYVGYVEKGSSARYYNSTVEQSLNIYR